MLTFCPPGPLEREKLICNSSRGIFMRSVKLWIDVAANDGVADPPGKRDSLKRRPAGAALDSRAAHRKALFLQNRQRPDEARLNPPVTMREVSAQKTSRHLATGSLDRLQIEALLEQPEEKGAKRVELGYA